MRYNSMFSALFAAAVLTSCGGAGGGGNNAPAGVTLTGTAATGAPFEGAAVSILDKNGNVVGTGSTGADGSYSIQLDLGAEAPFVIQAVRDDLTLVSVADGTSTTANITPVTNLVASLLSPSGDPTKLAAEMQANANLVSSTTVNATVAQVVAVLKPLLDEVGTTTNPLTGTFQANGTGLDRALDSLSIKITPASGSTANIEIALKQKSGEDEQPTMVQFTNATATLPTLPAVDASTLVDTGLAVQIADLLQRSTACYAMPVAQRVATPDAASADASDITAAACRSLFVDNDPATFLHEGQRISGALPRSKPFSGLFRTLATGVVFDRGAYEFTRANDDIVISYRVVDSAGGAQNLAGVVRKSPSNNKLYFIGNQYQFAGGVQAYHQLRTFVNQAEASYYSTGYAFNVPANNTLDRVVVTTPKGATLVLRNSPGSGAMRLVKGGAPSGTSYLRVRGEYLTRAETENPADVDTSLVFAQVRATNAQIAEYPQQSTWKFDYYLAASPGVLHTTQYYKTRARAMTISELKAVGLAHLNADVITDLRAGSLDSGVFPLNFTGPAILGWTVSNGALAPTEIRMFGRGPLVDGQRQHFDDGTAVSSTMRQGNIVCALASGADNHCLSSGGASHYAPGGYATGLDLVANDALGRTFSHFNALYKMTLP